MGSTMVDDTTEPYKDALRRIRQLERLNATLAAEVDRMQPIVDAVLAYNDSRRDPTKDRIALLHKIQYTGEHYEAAKREGGDGA